MDNVGTPCGQYIDIGNDAGVDFALCGYPSCGTSYNTCAAGTAVQGNGSTTWKCYNGGKRYVDCTVACSNYDCAGTCNGFAIDYNGTTAGCGLPPVNVVLKRTYQCNNNVRTNTLNTCSTNDTCSNNVAPGGSLCCASTPTGTCNCTPTYGSWIDTVTSSLSLVYQCNGTTRQKQQNRTNSCSNTNDTRYIDDDFPSGETCDATAPNYCRGTFVCTGTPVTANAYECPNTQIGLTANTAWSNRTTCA